MEAKQKAKDLVKMYLNIKMSPSIARQHQRAKECALILVNEMIAELDATEEVHKISSTLPWWHNVKREIEKL